MIWSFGDCEVDEGLYQLRRGGQVVRVEPKVFDVLLHLLERREQVVSKDALLDALWPGEAVTESVLPRCIAAARRAVGDDRTRQAVIRTVHGRGYRFVAELGDAFTVVEETPGPAASEPLPTPLRSDFVGRESALARLRSAFDDARAGRGRLVLLVGEPGIGKTRTSEELGDVARRSGATWLVGRCFEGEGAPAFWPWTQVLRDAVAGLPEADRAAALGPGAADLLTLVPALREAFPDVATPRPTHPSEGEQARFRLFDAVASFLRRCSERTPLVIVLDDLHWADADSLWLLQFLAGELRSAPVLLLATYRDIEVRRAHPLAQLLGALAREPHCERVLLRGLASDEVAQLVERVVGHAPEVGLIAAVGEMTEGNPFFVHEIVRLLAEQGRLETDADGNWSLALPQSVRDVIGRRLDSLSAECNALLRTAAVIGREFPAPLLARVTECDDETLLELLGEVLASQVLVECEGSVGRYAFQHALTRQTLYEELAVPLRVRLHRRVGEALEASYGDRSDAPMSELAHHFLEAAASGDVESAIGWSERAAQRAASLHAHDESARHYIRALEVGDLAGSVDEARRLSLLLGLGDAHAACGERSLARPRFAAAAELARRLGKPVEFARAAVGFQGYGEMGAGPDAEALALLEESLVQLGDAHPAERARVLSRLTGTPPHTRTMARRDALSREALGLAQRSGDAAALAEALTARYWACLGPDRLDERLAIAEEIMAHASRLGERRLELLGREVRIGVLLVRGEIARAGAEVEAYEAAALELRQPVFAFLAAVMQGSRLLNLGRFDEAEARFAQAVARGHGTVSYGELLARGQELWLRSMRGDSLLDVESESGGALSANTRNWLGIERIVRVGFGLSHTVQGDLVAAQKVLDECAPEIDALERDEHWLMTLGSLAELAIRLEDGPRCEMLILRLVPYRDLVVTHDLLRTVNGTVVGALGGLQRSLGRLDESVASYDEALLRETEMGTRPSRARCLVGLAATLRRRAGPGDAARAREFEVEARSESRALGMQIYGLPDA